MGSGVSVVDMIIRYTIQVKGEVGLDRPGIITDS